ncbi:hypothetical protein NDU88_007928 [Pleurodeles waltl]|uniref:Reverse transcriptase zinc-binding domain-containing protein n=1 Tax=Pleurodeles waltl TaxID=8319 RepID=A0AAV7QNH3_PLEWA|nr:hypothetical protein NDU88_007928 [Pleurodeles waltl]
MFATVLAPRLLAVYNEAFNAKILPDSMREGLIAMIPKSEMAASDPGPYHLSTMIKLDVKVLSKILAVRLAAKVTHLVHFDQCLEFWDLPAFRHLAAMVDARAWQEAGCLTLADLYPSETFIPFQVARDTFGLNQGQSLTYASILNIAREIWPTYLEAPPSSVLLWVLLEYRGGGQPSYITYIYKAMVADTPKPVLRAQVAWDGDLNAPLEEVQWKAICALLRQETCNARVKLIHFNYIHRTYVTPAFLHKIDPSSCQRCNVRPATFLRLAWDCHIVQTFWEAVVQTLGAVGVVRMERTPVLCLLWDVKRKKGYKNGMEICAIGAGVGKAEGGIYLDECAGAQHTDVA